MCREERNLCEYFKSDHEIRRVRLNTIVCIRQERVGDDIVAGNPQILVILNNRHLVLAHAHGG